MQHIRRALLSFSFYKLFEAANIGFHLALDYATIDFDKPLSREQIAEAELLANSYVWRNLPVKTAFYDSEEDVKSLPLRKHAEGLTAPIRIVSIEDADMCTCCAPHCALTGEIGSIFVLDAAGYKGGTRVTFLCGERALKRHRAEPTIWTPSGAAFPPRGKRCSPMPNFGQYAAQKAERESQRAQPSSRTTSIKR